MRLHALALLLALLIAGPLACAEGAAPPPSSPPSVAAPPSRSSGPTADDVFAALKARDVAKLAAVLDANASLAGARRADGTSAIVVALFTLNDDEETFVKPPDNRLLRALADRHPPLDIYDASAAGDLEHLRTLLSGDPTLANALHPRLGITPLHLAAFAGNTRGIEVLLSSGATLDLASHNKFHNTPLVLSVLSDQYDAASALLAKGANVEAAEEGGVRALHLAAELGDVRLLGLLLEHRAMVDARTDDGKTALDLATKRGRREAASFLRERGAH